MGSIDNNTTGLPLPEVKIGEGEVLANLIYPATEEADGSEE